MSYLLYKSIYFVLALSFGLNRDLPYVAGAKSALPVSIRKDLDRRFGNWHRVAHKAENGRTCPDLIEGDFDGNSQID